MVNMIAISGGTIVIRGGDSVKRRWLTAKKKRKDHS
jgi:hypothetical protein